MCMAFALGLGTFGLFEQLCFIHRSSIMLWLQTPGSDVLRVSNGFMEDYQKNGYRDVKVHVSMEEHVCEIQLHLRPFYQLKDGQHKVYDWSRELRVTADTRAEHLFENLERGVLAVMIQHAREDWYSTGVALRSLLGQAGESEEAGEIQRQVMNALSRAKAFAFRFPRARRLLSSRQGTHRLLAAGGIVFALMAEREICPSVGSGDSSLGRRGVPGEAYIRAGQRAMARYRTGPRDCACPRGSIIAKRGECVLPKIYAGAMAVLMEERSQNDAQQLTGLGVPCKCCVSYAHGDHNLLKSRLMRPPPKFTTAQIC